MTPASSTHHRGQAPSDKVFKETNPQGQARSYENVKKGKKRMHFKTRFLVLLLETHHVRWRSFHLLQSEQHCRCWRRVDFKVKARAIYIFPAENYYFWIVCSFLPFNFNFNNSLTMFHSNVIIPQMKHMFLGNFLPKGEAVNIHFAFPCQARIFIFYRPS